MRTSDIKRLGEAFASVVSPQIGYTDDEIKELCHSKDHNCAITVNHPEWGLGKPVYESHAIPDDEGNVEWYDVQFKHGLEKKVPASDMEVIEEAHHMKKKKTEGNAFGAALQAAKKNGDEKFVMDITKKYYKINKILSKELIQVGTISLSNRLSWEIVTDNQLKIILGQDNVLKKLSSFITHYQDVLYKVKKRIEYVDLRYKDGFSVKVINESSRKFKKEKIIL